MKIFVGHRHHLKSRTTVELRQAVIRNIVRAGQDGMKGTSADFPVKVWIRLTSQAVYFHLGVIRTN